MKPIAIFLFYPCSVQKKGTNFFVDLEFYGWNSFSSYLAFTRLQHHRTIWPPKVESFKLYILFSHFAYHFFVLELQFCLTEPWRLELKRPRLWFSYTVCTLRRIFKCAENHFSRCIFLKYRVFLSKCFHVFLATSTFWGIEKRLLKFSYVLISAWNVFQC